MASHVCGVEPEHSVEPGEQTPEHVPPPLHTNGHVVVAFHAPALSQVCDVAPEHCVSPGTHVPVHTPF